MGHLGLLRHDLHFYYSIITTVQQCKETQLHVSCFVCTAIQWGDRLFSPDSLIAKTLDQFWVKLFTSKTITSKSKTNPIWPVLFNSLKFHSIAIISQQMAVNATLLRRSLSSFSPLRSSREYFLKKNSEFPNKYRKISL